MAIVRLALANPPANTDTLLHTATRQSLVSVIATNTAPSTATVDVWVQPQGATSASAYAYMAKNTVLPANNSLETFRFALQTNDALYIRSSTANVSFSVNAIYESSGNQNIVTVSNVPPNAPSLGDVWVNSSSYSISFWDGSSWINAVVVAGVSSINGQTGAITNIATTSGKLSQFAATTSLELAGVISDETGSGSLVFAGSPNFTGIPTAPTASAGTSTTQIATTEYVTIAISSTDTGLNPFLLGGM